MKIERMAEQTKLSSEAVSASEHARQLVAWAKKKTVGLREKDPYKVLDKNSAAVVGEDEAGRKVFDVQFPHVSVGSAEQVVKTNKAATGIWKKELNNAVHTGLLTNAEAQKIALESGPHISFQNQAKGVFKTERKRDDQKEGKSTRTAMPLAQIAQRATAQVASPKGARLLTVGGIVMLASSACTVPEVAPVARPTEPAVAEAIPVSTASPEAISSFNESAQRIVDEAFRDLGVHDVNMVGAGILADPEGKKYALFTSKLPDKNNATDLDFLLIGEVGTGNQIETIKGLVIDEEKVQGPILEFLAVSFNADTQTFTVEGPLIRTNTQTGDIEVFRNGAWQVLNGPDKTTDDIQERLGVGVLAARALPTPTAEVIEPSYKLEDGTQMEKVEQGQFVDLFPGSEVYMSERGDVVIINKETGLELAGQKVETKYGSFTLLLAKSYYQYFYEWDYAKPTDMAGYPDLINGSSKEEVGRIASTLIELKKREISLGSVNLATHQPKPKNVIAIYLKMGTSYQISNSMPEGFIKPEELKTISNGELAFPTKETKDGTQVLVWFQLADGLSPARDPKLYLLFHLADHQHWVLRNLLAEAAGAQGMDDRFYRRQGYEGLKKSPFGPLFSHPDIDFFVGYPSYWKDLSIEERIRALKWGVEETVEVDLEKFK